MKLFVSPHNDDETLFGAFTLMTEKPIVCVVYDSYVQAQRGIPGCDWHARRLETVKACQILGIPLNSVFFLGFRDDVAWPEQAIAERLATVIHLASASDNIECAKHFSIVYAPASYSPQGNYQHNKVSKACYSAFQLPDQLRYYHTYTSAGKVTNGVRVKVPESLPAVQLKLDALRCYQSQINLWSTRDHFLRDQYEYMEA